MQYIFDFKVYYKAIEILAVRWLGTRLMHIFKEPTIRIQATKAGQSPGNDDEVSIILLFSI